MTIDRIDSIIDIPKIHGEVDALIIGLRDSKAALLDLHKTAQSYKGAEITTLAASTEKLTESMTEAAAASTKVVQSNRALIESAKAQSTAILGGADSYAYFANSVQEVIRQQLKLTVQLSANKDKLKENEAAFKAGKISLDQYKDTQIELTEASKRMKIENNELNKSINLQIKQNNTVGGSLEDLTNQYNALYDVFKKLSNEERSSEFGQQLATDLGNLKTNINEVQKSAGNFSANVGRYAGSFKEAFGVLESELTKVRQQLATMNPKAAGFDELAKEEKLLTTLTDGLNKEFTSTTQEARALQKAAVTLGVAMGNSSITFTSFKDAVGEAVDSVGDINDQIKLAASDTRTLDGLIDVAQGLAGGFALAQGSAALLGIENENLEKTFVKLQAVMTILQGLEAIRNATKKESAALDFIMTARTKALAVAQGIYTVAVGASTGAMKAFRIALLSTGILAIVGALVLAGKAMYDFAQKTKEAKDNAKLLGEINATAAESAGKEAASLKILRAEIESTTVPMQTRLQAVKDLKEQYPKYFEGLTTEQILTGKVANAYDLAAAAILRKAKANAAAAEIEKNSSEALAIELDLELKAIETNKKIAEAQADAAVSSGGSAGAGGNFGGVSKRAKQIAFKEDFQIEKNAAQEQLRLIAQKNNLLIKFVLDGAEENVKIEKDKTEKVKKETEKQLALAKDFEEQKLKAIAETNKTELELMADQQQRISDAENKSILDRVFAVQRYEDAKEAILDLGADEELRQLEVQRDAINKEYDKRVKDAKGNNSEILKINAERDKEIKSFDAFAAEEQRKIAANLNLQKVNLSFDASQKIIKIQEDLYKSLADLYKESEKDFMDSIDRMVDAKIAANKKDPPPKKTAEELRIEKLDILAGKITNFQTLSNNIFSAYGEIASISIDKQKVALEELEASQQKNYENEVNRINASAKTDAEKADQLKILEASRMAQKEQNERKARQLEIQRAKFEKAANIANIISSTALAVVNALKTQPAPLGIALAATIGILGAAQLARAIATPLPKYEKGTQHAKEGWAVTDEKGAELYIEPGGKSFMGSDEGPVTRYLKAGTKIIPADEVNQSLNNAMIRQTAMAFQNYNKPSENEHALNEIKDAILQSADASIREMRRQKKGTRITNVIDLGWGNYIKEKTFNA